MIFAILIYPILFLYTLLLCDKDFITIIAEKIVDTIWNDRKEI